jgi:ankyrin repeat protein
MKHEDVGEFIDAVVNAPARGSELLRSNPELLNARWLHNETVLHFLCVEGYAEGVRFLIEAGAQVDATNEFGGTALVDMVLMGNTSIAKLLVEAGANPNASSPTSDNILQQAVFAGNMELAEVLIRAGAHTEDLRSFIDELGYVDTDLAALLAKHGKSS